ncbi:hypothetical protein [Candidatus Phytoplasma oryzae]|nr:hypothetical protein PIE28_00610 [Candidatus Phytoplasma oryzae]
MFNKKNVNIDFDFFFFSWIVLLLSIIKGYQKPFFSFYLFTRQTVLLINLYFLTKLLFKQKNKYFLFICALDSLMMMIIYFKNENRFLLAQRTHFQFLVSVLEHYFLTTIFLFYYLIIDKTFLKFKNFYIGTIHLLVYFITSLYFGKKYHYYPYDFLNPYNRFFWFKTTVLSFLTILMSFFLIYIKRKKLNFQFLKNKIISNKSKKIF